MEDEEIKERLKGQHINDLIKMLYEKMLEGEEGGEPKEVEIEIEEKPVSSMIEERELDDELEEPLEEEQREEEEMERDRPASPDEEVMDGLKGFLNGDRDRREERVKSVYSDDVAPMAKRNESKEKDRMRSKDRDAKRMMKRG